MLVDNLLKTIQQYNTTHETYHADNKRIVCFVDKLYDALFIDIYKLNYADQLNTHIQSLKLELHDILYDLYKSNDTALTHTEAFFNALSDITTTLYKDAQQAFESDPAASSLSEILNAYPGFYAIALFRFAHQLDNQHIILIPRMITEYAHNQTGIDIHPSAKIGSNFVIDHGTGIVIGETAHIGDYVTIYQGVTLGAIFVEKSLAEKKRHPTIEDHVVIYANATILGGNTTIGHHTIIGGNVWLTKSVDPYAVVYQDAKVVIRNQSPLPEPINFVI